MRRKLVVAAVLSVAAIVLFTPSSASAQAGPCYSCVWSPEEGLKCNGRALDGKERCELLCGPGYCTCEEYGAACSMTGSLTPDGTLSIAAGTIFTPLDDVSASDKNPKSFLVRRDCDGAVISRRYTAAYLESLRRQLQQIRI